MNSNEFKQLVLYGIFGVLTTIINIVVYWLCTRMLFIPVVPSTVIAWLVAVFFAYYTNRTYVFHSTSSNVMKEAMEFFFARLATGLMDIAIMFVFVDLLGLYDFAVKAVSNVLVIIINYIASKFFIFKGDKAQ